jgi:hypothetical protein
VSWIVTHNELDVMSPEIVHSLISDVFKNPEKGRLLGNCHAQNHAFLTIPAIASWCVACMHATPLACIITVQVVLASKFSWSWSSFAQY